MRYAGPDVGEVSVLGGYLEARTCHCRQKFRKISVFQTFLKIFGAEFSNCESLKIFFSVFVRLHSNVEYSNEKTAEDFVSFFFKSSKRA